MNTLIKSILLITIASTSLLALNLDFFKSDQGWINRNLKRLNDGKEAVPLYRIFDAYYKCKQKINIKRGEYETKEEYKKRLLNQGNCDSLYPVKALYEEPVVLHYDVDNQRFTFNINTMYYQCSDKSFKINNQRHCMEIKTKITYNNLLYIDDNYFYSNKLTTTHFILNSKIKKAKFLKIQEKNLIWKVYGKIYDKGASYTNWYGWGSKIEKQIRHKSNIEVYKLILFNKEINKPLLILSN